MESDPQKTEKTLQEIEEDRLVEDLARAFVFIAKSFVDSD